MIGTRVTADAPREQKQLGAFGKKSGLSSRLFLSFPVPAPATNFLSPPSPSVFCCVYGFICDFLEFPSVKSCKIFTAHRT